MSLTILNKHRGTLKSLFFFGEDCVGKKVKTTDSC